MVGVAVRYVSLLSLWTVLGYCMTGELGNGHVQYICKETIQNIESKL